MTRYGLEARWLATGPPSGRRFVAGILRELGRHAKRPDGIVAFVPRGVDISAPGVKRIPLLQAPAPLFHGGALNAPVNANIKTGGPEAPA